MVPAWLNSAEQHWNKWAIRVAAVSSLAAHIIVLVLADFRRYNRVWPFCAPFLWLAYQILDIAGSFALGNLMLNDTGGEAATDSEQVAVAFWAPFLLLHLGGPDNVAAYSLDDDNLGWRKVVVGLPKIVGAVHILLFKIWLNDNGGLLIPASIVMMVVGIFRFIENVVAMILALKRPATRILRNSATTVSWRQGWEKLWDDVNEYAIKVYENLYTKAGVVHSWTGYIHRLIAPLATATAFILFSLYPKECLQPADVKITYILMSFALVLDVVWLVAAMASKSAEEFLEATSCIWFRHQILCSGWWHRLNRLAPCLRPARLLGLGPSNYGSDFFGRYDLVGESTRAPPGCIARLWSKLGSFFSQDDSGWSDYRSWKSSSKLQPDVKKVLFNRIKERLSPASDATKNTYDKKDIRACWGQEAVRRKKDIFQGIKLEFFGREFQEDILLWHIATTIYLCSNNNYKAETMPRVRAIEAVSEYLMFLLAARPHMLPDPPLRSLYVVTQQALQDLYKEEKANANDLCCASKKKQLANILLSSKEQNYKDGNDRRLIWYAAELASQLQNLDASHVVELVFDVWVDKLLYAGIKCNRDSHARQLGKGGELVTIAWIAAEYAGVFTIGETGPKKAPDDPVEPDPCCIKEKIKRRKCPDREASCYPACHCHKDPSKPVCPHTCCVQDYYGCTQDYDHC